MTYTVTLIRGPKEPRTWNDATERRALQRVYALTDLHGNCPFERVGNSWTIDATKHYTPRRCRHCDNPPAPGYGNCLTCAEEVGGDY